jgi:hypothetical protein
MRSERRLFNSSRTALNDSRYQAAEQSFNPASSPPPSPPKDDDNVIFIIAQVWKKKSGEHTGLCVELSCAFDLAIANGV